MRLDVNIRYAITRTDPSDHIIHWVVDVCAPSDSDDPDEPQHYTVGRILADEIRRFEIQEWNEDPWTAADADSSSLEGAYATLVSACGGESIDNGFNCINEPVVYVYRFKLHDGFSKCKLAVMDAFCRLFPNEALIMAQYHTTWLSLSEFSNLGFRKLIKEGESDDQPFDPFEQNDGPRFMIRDNTLATKLRVTDYPEDPPYGTAEHEQWIEDHGPWEGLV